MWNEINNIQDINKWDSVTANDIPFESDSTVVVVERNEYDS